MEVTAETYKAYYKDKRRQKYIDERSLLNGDVSYDALDTDETLGAEVFADTKTNVEATVWTVTAQDTSCRNSIS